MRWSLRSLPIQAILWFYEKEESSPHVKFKISSQCVQAHYRNREKKVEKYKNKKSEIDMSCQLRDGNSNEGSKDCEITFILYIHTWPT